MKTNRSIKHASLFLMFLVLASLAATPAGAEPGPFPQPPRVGHSAPSWDVAFWNNISLQGYPTVTGSDSSLNHDWGTGSPHAGIAADWFSARWQRYIQVPEGLYRFTATSDDGIRVWVDGRLIIDRWFEQSVRTVTADVRLTADHHLIQVDYFEKMGLAEVRLSWEPVRGPSDAWRAEYFNNVTLQGTPALVRYDQSLGFNWSYGSPAPSIGSDNFSVRWTRSFNFSPGVYQFTTTTDDGVRLRVNGHLLINQWYDQALSAHSGSIYLAGDVPIVMEYYERTQLASAWLTWARSDQGPPPPPYGDGAERISFAPGATQTSLGGYLRSGQSKELVLHVMAGQYMAIDAAVGASGPGLRFSVTGADGTLMKPMGEPHLRTVVPSTQDYTIKLVSDIGATSYQMSVLIPVRISFPPGSISGTAYGELSAGAARHYVLRALGGQRMTIIRQVYRGQPRLTVSGADGQVLISGRVGQPGDIYGLVLPTPQEYLVTVWADGGMDTSYALEITIPPL